MYWAHHRLAAAEKRLGELRPFSELRRSGRKEKTSVLDQVDRFSDDARQAEAKIAGCHETLDELRPQIEQRAEWDADLRLARISPPHCRGRTRPNSAIPPSG